MTIELIPISNLELKDLITECFASDFDLCQKYHHLAPARNDRISQHTYDTIMDGSEETPVKCMRVILSIGDAYETIGYTVLVDSIPDKYNMLYSFCIIKKYRLPLLMYSWLAEVQKHLGRTFTVGLWNKNTRAINFFKKNGFEIVQKEEKHSILLINKEVKICHL